MSYKPGDPNLKTHGFLIALSIFALTVLQAVCMNQYNLIVMQTGLRIQSALAMSIYEKSTKLSNKARSRNPSGTIINLIAVDVMRVKKLSEYGHMLWSTPLYIGLTLYSLYQLLGVSAFVGFAALIGIIPLNTYVSKSDSQHLALYMLHANCTRFMQGGYAEQRKNRDARTKLLTEMLTHVKSRNPDRLLQT